MNYDRAAMKQEVKRAMRQTRPHPMLVTLLYLVIVSTVAGLISWIIDIALPGGNALLNDLLVNIQQYGEDYLEYIIEDRPDILIQLLVQWGTVSLLVSILTTIWNGLMNVGYSGYCLDLSRGANPGFERIFSGFPRAGSVILSYILVTVFTFLWSMLFGIGLGLLFFLATLLMNVGDALVIVGALLLFAALVLYAIALIWVTYRYAMVPFAIIDSQNPLSAMEAINVSKTIMKGRKGSFFVLRLSFIGWYLLEYLVVTVGASIAIIIAAVSFNDVMYYDYSGVSLLAIIPIVLLCSAAIFVINLWLAPYRTTCEARFYIYATGGAQPIQPSPYQPGPYGGQYGPYGGGQPGQYGGQSGPYNSQPGPYGGQYGPYNNNPYGYNPPNQSSFGSYTQAGQPPQYGTGTYSQWGAPQPPAIPTAPSAPAAPEAPVTPEPPAGPETVAAPTFAEPPAVPAAPEEPDDAMYEAPYAEPEAPNNDDDTPQRPSGPSYPQY